MKRLLAITLFLSFTAIGLSQTTPIVENRGDAIYLGYKQLIETQQYQFKGEWVIVDKKRTNIDSALNSLVINNASVSAQFNNPDDNSSSFSDSGQLNNYKVSYNDEIQKINIDFNLGNRTFYFEIRNNGKVFLKHKTGTGEILWIGQLSKL